MSSQDFLPNLQLAYQSIRELKQHISDFNLDELMYHAPIIDRIKFEPWKQDDIMGYKKWMDGIWNHEILLSAMIKSGIPPKDDPLPTVSNLLTFWKIIITSQTPIVGVKMSMGGDRRLSNGFGIGNIPSKYKNKNKSNENDKENDNQSKVLQKKSQQKEKEVWVDVIAQGGKEWIRIYSKKISHLLAEFREADSYINSDYDSDSSASSSSSSKNKSKQPVELDNSLITAAKDLLRAASLVDRIPGSPIPKITIHLTRIPSTPKEFYEENNTYETPQSDDESTEELDWPDSRIPATFSKIRSMGVKLIFGDLSNIPLSSLSSSSSSSSSSKTLRLKPIEPKPSLKLNLDITTLMGLCSDVLHYPLPTTKEEAAKRSLRPINQLDGNVGNTTGRGRDGTGKGKNKSKTEEDVIENHNEIKGQSQNSIELYRCILEEMERPFIDEFNQVIDDAVKYQQISSNSWNLEDEALNEDIKSKLNLNPSTLPPPPKVEFWTTLEAAQYTYEALSSGPAHGEGYEQKRMRIMLGLEKGNFFDKSRYDTGDKQGYLKDLKVNIFDLDNQENGEEFKPRGVEEVLRDARKRGEDILENNNQNTSVKDDRNGYDEIDNQKKTGFHQTLSTITTLFLNQYYSSLITPTPPTIQAKNKPFASTSSTNLPNFLQPRKLPTPPIAKISLPFPVVSLHSLNRGSKESMTTIMMGTATLKEVWGQTLWRIRGWERGWYNWEDSIQKGDLDVVEENNNNEGKPGLGNREREKGYAAVMIFPYRVFGEGKRVRFSKGDYSYPTKEWWDADEGVNEQAMVEKSD